MVEGRLSDKRREPANVQVQIQERDGAEYVMASSIVWFLDPRACIFPLKRMPEKVRQRDVINYSLAHVRERNANLEARSRARVVGQGTKRRC